MSLFDITDPLNPALLAQQQLALGRVSQLMVAGDDVLVLTEFSLFVSQNELGHLRRNGETFDFGLLDESAQALVLVDEMAPGRILCRPRVGVRDVEVAPSVREAVTGPGGEEDR